MLAGLVRFKADMLALDAASTDLIIYQPTDWLTDQYSEDKVLQNIVPGILFKPASDGYHWFKSLTDEIRRRLAYDLRA